MGERKRSLALRQMLITRGVHPRGSGVVAERLSAMDEQTARQKLEAAVAKRDEAARAADQAREELYAVIREVSPPLRQVDVVKATGWSREHIRKLHLGQ